MRRILRIVLVVNLALPGCTGEFQWNIEPPLAKKTAEKTPDPPGQRSVIRRSPAPLPSRDHKHPGW